MGTIASGSELYLLSPSIVHVQQFPVVLSYITLYITFIEPYKTLIYPHKSLDCPPSTECLQLRSPGESPTQPHGAEAEPQAGFRV